MTSTTNQSEHLRLIRAFLTYLAGFSNGRGYILKGGTALLYYGLDRFSEDIDLDGVSSNSLRSAIHQFCLTHNLTYRVAKDTSTVFRVILHYQFGTVKIELSMRQPDYSKTTYIDGVLIYTWQYIAFLKVRALAGRAKLRDLYDIAWLATNPEFYGLVDVVSSLKFTLESRYPLNYLDDYIQTQYDDIIPNESVQLLYVRLLDLYERLEVS